MAVTVANGRLGPAQIEVDSTDMGGTLGAVQLEVTVEEQEIKFDQLGTGPADMVRTGMRATVTIPWAEDDIDKLATYMPGTSVVTDTTKKKIVVSTGVGQQTLRDSLEVKIVVKPLVNPTTVSGANEWITFSTAHLQPNISKAYAVDGQRVVNITAIALPDANGDLFIIGDETAV